MVLVDYIIVISYLLMLILIGLITTKKIKKHSDFIVAGRRLSYNLYIPAMAAVVLGGASTFGGTALGYQFGISGMWMVTMIGLGIISLGFFFSKRLSELNIFSVSELLGKRFGKVSSVYSAIVLIIYNLMVMVTSIIGIGVLFSAIFNFDTTKSIIIGGLIVICYTLLGGMWAVTMTDVIQFWIMTVGFIAILLPLGFNAAGGIEGFTNNLDASYFSFTDIGIKRIFTFFLLYIFGMMIGQDVWQRALTGKNEAVLKKGTIYAGIYCVFYGIVGALIGMTSKVLHPNLADSQQALPELILSVLPVGLIGVVVAAVVSASMSTASGTVMAASTIITNDLILGKKDREETDAKKVFTTRVIILILGIIGVIIATRLQNIVVALDLAYALLSGSLFIPIVAALFWKDAPKKIILLAMITSSLVVIIDLIIEGVTSTNGIIYGILTGVCIVLFSSLYEKLFTNSKKYPETKADESIK